MNGQKMFALRIICKNEKPRVSTENLEGIRVAREVAAHVLDSDPDVSRVELLPVAVDATGPAADVIRR